MLNELDVLHAKAPLDLVLITGDMTDAGSSAEWAEFLDAMTAHPTIAERVLILPGNHDLNIVDRANPARMDLPTSPNRRLRQLRTLSAMMELQGNRVRVVEYGRRRIGKTLAEYLEPHLKQMVRFADRATPLLSYALPELWAKAFPMVLPPDEQDGLGVIVLNSNADTHFSFTNALGMVSAEQVVGIEIASKQYPQACWIIALHHHVVEYPRPAKALSERIGTALINGNWFMRMLKPLGRPGHPDARSPAYRLDRSLRRARGGLGAVAGDGSDQRANHRLLHSLRSRSAPTDSSGCSRRSALPSPASPRTPHKPRCTRRHRETLGLFAVLRVLAALRVIGGGVGRREHQA